MSRPIIKLPRKPAPKADISPNARKWADGELPQGIIGVQPKAPQ